MLATILTIILLPLSVVYPQISSEYYPKPYDRARFVLSGLP